MHAERNRVHLYSTLPTVADIYILSWLQVSMKLPCYNSVKMQRLHQKIPHIGFAHMCTRMCVRALGCNPPSWLSSVSDQHSSLRALIVLSFSSGLSHHKGLCWYLLRSYLVRTLYPFSWETGKLQLTPEVSNRSYQQFIQLDFNCTFKSRRFNFTPSFQILPFFSLFLYFFHLHYCSLPWHWFPRRPIHLEIRGTDSAHHQLAETMQTNNMQFIQINGCDDKEHMTGANKRSLQSNDDYYRGEV